MPTAAQETRRQHARARVHRHHLHGGELLAGLHQADLGGERGAGAAGEQQRRDHRPQLAHQRQVDDQPERLRGAIGDQRVVHLQRQHEAHGQARRQDDDQRAVAHGMDLVHHQAEAGEGHRHVRQQVGEEDGGAAEAVQHTQRARTDEREQVHAPTPKSSARLGAG
jgi:hypothetical protein